MTTPHPVLRFARQHDLNNQTCRLSSLCLPSILSSETLDRFGVVAKRTAPLRKRDALYLQGMPFNSLYVIHSGSLKQVSTTDNQEEHVTSFFLPGEIIGLDAIGEQRYPGNAIALETTTLFELPFDRLEALTCSSPELRNYLYQCMSKELQNERLLMHMLLRKTSDVRLATFFVAMSLRFRRRGYSPYCFNLAMSRGDIGSYLGLAVETVSRLLGRFQQQGLITSRGREFHIHDLEALTRLADSNGRC
ncbi:helix-turn-helix domain-containing protein [Halomonas sp. McH1-25]|uniref:helix-turn-helix domain-containing protein n=1 Tax=unclassified Halomonas TaxID=2609666 RepID=UPI001EF634CD|nr:MULTISPECIES: helix-turn-helix domain-containing protein [unclassified Halomonas]MCG7599074.1 helix-turn-helix domain-containing protein [Halomonas sp. McH1-25]MCP1342369.1 helix-turn-helix domain-containing protein [Halomonas sp. FL8]MCP1360377.1 helix-turn-helix domain-containing protein [Halomonas sp. BBD45]MCP1364548.1 helix-turn-helix domain-containing protein [Halomonas sp. BBD48]